MRPSATRVHKPLMLLMYEAWSCLDPNSCHGRCQKKFWRFFGSLLVRIHVFTPFISEKTRSPSAVSLGSRSRKTTSLRTSCPSMRQKPSEHEGDKEPVGSFKWGHHSDSIKSRSKIGQFLRSKGLPAWPRNTLSCALRWSVGGVCQHRTIVC